MVKNIKYFSANSVNLESLIQTVDWLINDRPQSNPISGLSEPILPLRQSAPNQAKKALSKFILKIDKEYRQSLAKQKVTSNIMFIGKSKK